MSDMSNRFESAAKSGNASFGAEIWQFLRDSKKWWMLPIFAVLLFFALLMFAGGTAAAPFIYTLF